MKLQENKHIEESITDDVLTEESIQKMEAEIVESFLENIDDTDEKLNDNIIV